MTPAVGISRRRRVCDATSFRRHKNGLYLSAAGIDKFAPACRSDVTKMDFICRSYHLVRADMGKNDCPNDRATTTKEMLAATETQTSVASLRDQWFEFGRILDDLPRAPIPNVASTIVIIKRSGTLFSFCLGLRTHLSRFSRVHLERFKSVRITSWNTAAIRGWPSSRPSIPSISANVSAMYASYALRRFSST